MARPVRHLLVAGLLVVALAAVPTAVGGAPRADDPSTTAPAGANPDDALRLNQIQVIGTHNSYHELASDPERILRGKILGSAEDQFEYEHRPLTTQFESEKVREIELDVFNDTKGGLYAHPLIRQFTNGGPYDDAVMDRPGLKVLHAQDVDYHSTCLTFQACLGEVKRWSDAHPTHMPIAILVELKDDIIDTGGITFVHPEKFDAPAMDRLDAEIRNVFPPADMITPDDVRGSHATLEQAVTTDGWPTLGESRGKVLFLMDNSSLRTTYLSGHPDLEGRVLFTNAQPGDPDAAFVEHNDPDVAQIQALVEQGYVVRTRADSPGGEAVTNDTRTLTNALASGAQWVSTDYPVPGYSDGYHSGGYVAAIPGGTVGRCNPVIAPATCDSAALDTNFSPAPRAPGIDPPVGALAPTTATTAPTAPPPVGSGTAPPAVAVPGVASFTG